MGGFFQKEGFCQGKRGNIGDSLRWGSMRGSQEGKRGKFGGSHVGVLR